MFERISNMSTNDRFVYKIPTSEVSFLKFDAKITGTIFNIEENNVHCLKLDEIQYNQLKTQFKDPGAMFVYSITERMHKIPVIVQIFNNDSYAAVDLFPAVIYYHDPGYGYTTDTFKNHIGIIVSDEIQGRVNDRFDIETCHNFKKWDELYGVWTVKYDESFEYQSGESKYLEAEEKLKNLTFVQ